MDSILKDKIYKNDGDGYGDGTATVTVTATVTATVNYIGLEIQPYVKLL